MTDLFCSLILFAYSVRLFCTLILLAYSVCWNLGRILFAYSVCWNWGRILFAGIGGVFCLLELGAYSVCWNWGHYGEKKYKIYIFYLILFLTLLSYVAQQKYYTLEYFIPRRWDNGCARALCAKSSRVLHFTRIFLYKEKLYKNNLLYYCFNFP